MLPQVWVPPSVARMTLSPAEATHHQSLASRMQDRTSCAVNSSSQLSPMRPGPPCRLSAQGQSVLHPNTHKPRSVLSASLHTCLHQLHSPRMLVCRLASSAGHPIHPWQVWRELTGPCVQLAELVSVPRTEIAAPLPGLGPLPLQCPQPESPSAGRTWPSGKPPEWTAPSHTRVKPSVHLLLLPLDRVAGTALPKPAGPGYGRERPLCQRPCSDAQQAFRPTAPALATCWP